jgi:hemerythrin-like domain-containing protein
MCNYCGCRSIEPIAELTAEHEQVLNLRGDIRRAVRGGDFEQAVGLVRELRELLLVHDAVEELAVYPAMRRFEEFTDKVGTLFDEHDEMDDVMDGIVAAADAGDDPAGMEWQRLLADLDVLAEHIDHEEHGMFPAAAVSLDPEDWERATAVRAEHSTSHLHSHPHGPGYSHGHEDSRPHEHAHSHAPA